MSIENIGLQRIVLDISKKLTQKTFYANEVDTNGRGFHAFLKNNNVTVDGTGVTLRFRYTSLNDGQAKTFDFVPLGLAVNGEFELHYPTEMVRGFGGKLFPCTIVASDLNGEIAFENIFVYVNKAEVPTEGIEATNELSSLGVALGKVDLLETTYAPRLGTVESQLAKTQSDFTSAVNTITANATVDSEVILARDGETTLANRLNAIETKVTTDSMPVYMHHRNTIEQIYPEGTMAGIEGVEAYNYALELDARKTKDGIIVLSHDATIDRCSNGTGTIANMYFDDLRQLDFGSKMNAKFAGAKIPTLEEVFKKYGKSKIYLLDVKSTAGDNLPADCARLVLKYNLKKNVIIALGNWADVDAVRAVDSTLKYGSLYVPATALTEYTSRGCKWVFYSLEILKTPSLIADIHAAGLKLNISVLGNKMTNNKLVAWGVDSIMCKNPSYLDGKIVTTTMTLPHTLDLSKNHLNQEWTTDSVHEKLKYSMVGDGIEQTIPSGTLDYCTYAGKKIVCDSFKVTATITPKVLNVIANQNVGFHFSNCDEFPLGTNGLAYYRDVHGYVPADLVNGYHIYLRQNGGIGITKVINGVAAGTTPTGSYWDAFPDMVVGTPLTVVITFTATTISVQVNGGTIHTVTDSSIARDFYMGFIWNKSGCKFSNVVVSAV